MEDILKKLISFPTVTGDAFAMHQLLNYVASFVSHRGMHVEWFESNGFESIVATTKQGNKTPKVMFAAHGDVVPADESLFTMRNEDGKYFGRGVLDMKGSLAAFLQVIDDLKGNIEAYDLALAVTADEEVGGENGLNKLIQEGYIPAVCIMPDGGENWQIQTMAKGFWSFNVIAEGAAIHGSRPWLGENAINKLVASIDDFRALFPKEMTLRTNTVSITRIQAGQALSQVPGLASLTLDVRTISREEQLRLYDALVAVCHKHQLDYSMNTEGWPVHFDLEHPLIAPFVRRLEATTGVTITGSMTPATNDARHFVPFNVPCISFYPVGGAHHSAGEWIAADTLEQMRTIMGGYLREIAQKG